MGRTTGKNKIAKKIAGQAVRHATGKVQGKAMRTAAAGSNAVKLRAMWNAKAMLFINKMQIHP